MTSNKTTTHLINQMRTKTLTTSKEDGLNLNGSQLIKKPINKKKRKMMMTMMKKTGHQLLFRLQTNNKQK